MVTVATVLGVVLLPVVGVAALLVLAERLQRGREAVGRRQIAVTDAIHRELGAVVAPVVTRRRLGRGWRLRVAVPFQSPATVERVVAIGHAAMLDTGIGEALELVLTAQDARIHARERSRTATASRARGEREETAWTSTSTSRAS
jgi:hypothetical protein